MKETVFGALHMIQSTGAGERGKEIFKHAHKDYLICFTHRQQYVLYCF